MNHARGLINCLVHPVKDPPLALPWSPTYMHHDKGPITTTFILPQGAQAGRALNIPFLLKNRPFYTPYVPCFTIPLHTHNQSERVLPQFPRKKKRIWGETRSKQWEGSLYWEATQTISETVKPASNRDRKFTGPPLTKTIKDQDKTATKCYRKQENMYEKDAPGTPYPNQ